MANMDYCKYQNTLTDLKQCFEALWYAGDSELSEQESKAKNRLIKLCKKIGTLDEEEICND